MPLIKTNQTKISDLNWLSEVKESKQPLSEQDPIWVRHGIVRSGPTIPYPERHPYCEFSTIMEGAATAYVGRENVKRLAGDYFLAGTGLAHWYRGNQYPVKFAAIYFLPSLLIEMGPVSDGMRILRRFTAHQSLADRLVRPPAFLSPRLRTGFEEMIVEFDRKSFGHELRLRTVLMEMLVQLLRWEHQTGRHVSRPSSSISWKNIDLAMKYLREHFNQEVYARDLAAVAGVSESRLKTLFHEVLGMPWSRYLKSYRIHRAAAFLSEPRYNVLEAALAVGFGSLSHFNATFRSIMGVSPGQYAKGATRKRSEKAG
jgi:AraC-like DNA-binding protein